jgi:chromosome transmission fidelity protein 18
LLHGPPGLGKTTLAHVIAKQCGYNIVEVNASDDRTSEVLKSKVLSAIEMQPVFGDRKPNLVIIDEIDGVSSAAGGSSDHVCSSSNMCQHSSTKANGQSFIKILVSLAAEENSANNGSSSNWEASKARKSKLNKSRTLMRPIICICNDL